MGIEDIAGEFLSSDKVEEVSDGVLDSIAGGINHLTGDRFAEQIDAVKGNIDAKVGDQ